MEQPQKMRLSAAKKWAIIGSITVGTLALSACSSAPVEEPASTSTEAPAESEEMADAPALAAEVETQISENFPGGITASSPLFAITEYEDVSSGTIRVYVQENLDKTGRDDIARQVFNMGGSENALKTVVVRDASGVDSNHYS